MARKGKNVFNGRFTVMLWVEKNGFYWFFVMFECVCFLCVWCCVL